LLDPRRDFARFAVAFFFPRFAAVFFLRLRVPEPDMRPV
jgi:hypothetical protein